MWNSSIIQMLWEGTLATLYMTLFSTIMAYVIGLPLGIALVITAKDGLKKVSYIRLPGFLPITSV